MNIGTKIYYDKATGSVIQLIPEQIGRGAVETTEDQDFASYKQLAERVRETVGLVKLEYGQYRKEFAECESYRVDPKTEELQFTYADDKTNVLDQRLAEVEFSSRNMANQLAEATTQLSDTQTLLAETQDRLKETEATLSDTKSALISSQEDLQSAKNELQDTKQELQTTKQTLEATQSETLDTQLAIAELYELVLAERQLAAEGGEVDNG